MRGKRIITYMLAGSLIILQAPLMSNHIVKAEPTVDSLIIAPVTVAKENSFEDILKLVKGKIEIPSSYKDFYYDYNDYRENAYWYFTWTNSTNNASVSVSCDNNGNIISYHNFSKYNLTVPKYLKSELKKDADAFLKQAAPELVDHVEYKGATFLGIGIGTYTYTYVRTENGILLPENKIEISINAETANVDSYYAEWDYDVTFDTTKAKITEENAKEILRDQITMNLLYQSRDRESDGSNKLNAYLVYAPNQSYYSVDAVTKEVYATKEVNGDYRNTAAKDMASTEEAAGMSSDYGAAVQLTEEEIAKIEENKKLISKEDAVKAITESSYLYVADDVKVTNCMLYEDNLDRSDTSKKSYVWNVTLAGDESSTAKGESYQYYANAFIDAQTSKIISFDCNENGYYYDYSGSNTVKKLKYDEKDCKKIFEEFANSQDEDMFSQCKLVDTKDGCLYTIDDEKKIYGSYVFSYDRVSNKIAFADNYVNGEVDRVTGKVLNYNTRWFENVSFEGKSGVISSKEAYNAYINDDGFGLVYEIVTDDETLKPVARLVYSTYDCPEYISPFTGEEVGYGGAKKATYSYTYSDISDSSSKRNIELLGDMGIGFDGGTFKPGQAITTEELNSLIAQTNYYYFTKSGVELAKGKTVSREKVAKYTIEILNLDYIGKLSDIFVANYSDKDSISKDFKGYVSLAEALGILKVDASNKFNPKASLTRAEAADMLLALIDAYGCQQ